MDKIKEEIMKHLENEIDDIEAYLEMAKICNENDHSKLGGILHDIAHDEYTHAKVLYDVLGHHEEVPEKVKTMWMDAHSKYHNI